MKNKTKKLSPAYEKGIKRVHIGSGPHNIMDNWWNVDKLNFPGVDEVMDVTLKWPYSNLQYVYGEHFIEHLDLDDALKFLTHAGNSLKDGGIIRLSTPNLHWVMLTHFDFDANTPKKKRLLDTLVTNRAFHGWGHRFLYTKEVLELILGRLGFQEITFYSYGESNNLDLRDIEKHGDFSVSEGQPSVIIVEAEKDQAMIEIPGDLLSFLDDNFIKHVKSSH